MAVNNGAPRQKLKRVRRDGVPLFEGLEPRTLLSATHHFADHLIVNPDFTIINISSEINAQGAVTTGKLTFVEPDTVPDKPAFVADRQTVGPQSSTATASKPTDQSDNTAKPLFEPGVYVVAWTPAYAPSYVISIGNPGSSGSTNSGASSTTSRDSDVTANTGNRSFSRRTDADQMPSPPPPAPVAAAAPNSSSSAAAVAQPGAASARFAAVLQQGNAAVPVHSQTPSDSQNNASMAINSASLQIATNPAGSKWPAPLADLFAADSSGPGGDLAVVAETFRAAGIFSSTAKSFDVMEKLLMSDAASLAHVANSVALRLYEEDALLWKGATGLLGVVMLVAAGANRARPTTQLPPRKRRKPKYLCVGEQNLLNVEY